MENLEVNRSEGKLDSSGKNLHKFGSALLSVKGKAGYPHLIPISYLRKKSNIYISSRETDFELPDIALGSKVSYSIVGYEQIIPFKLDGSPDSLFTIDLAKDIMDSKMEDNYTSFINKFAEGRVEAGVGIIEAYEEHDSILVIDVEESSRDYLDLDEE